MDKSSAACVKGCRTRGLHSALGWILSVALIIPGGIARAVDPKADGEGLIEPSGKDQPLKWNGSFSSLYEPSGIAPLPDGRFLIVEDESDRALRLVTAQVLKSHAINFNDETQLKPPSALTARLSVGVLDDLEGAAHDQMQRFYVISSHDDSAPYWNSKRQKLLRFSVQDGQMQNVVTKLTFRQDLLNSYPQLLNDAQDKNKKKAAGINIEALAYDRSRDVLLIGLRTPVLDGKAIIVRLKNPDTYLDGTAEPELDQTLWSIDLDQGGLRAMAYDDPSDQLLLISRREKHKDDSYKLWSLHAGGQEAATRIKIGDQEDRLDSVEGLVPVSLDRPVGSGVLFVRDNGNKKKGRGADWFFLTRKQLGLDLKAY